MESGKDKLTVMIIMVGTGAVRDMKEREFKVGGGVKREREWVWTPERGEGGKMWGSMANR